MGVHNPFCGHRLAIHGRRGDMVKLVWHDGDELYLFAKRLERERISWPQAESIGAADCRASPSRPPSPPDARVHGSCLTLATRLRSARLQREGAAGLLCFPPATEPAWCHSSGGTPA